MKRYLTLKTVLIFLLPLIFTLVGSQIVIALELKSTLYGTDAVFGNLLTVDRRTGEGTVVGNIRGFSIPSLALDPVTGVMYAGGGRGVPEVLTVDKTTGMGTSLGDSGLGAAAIGGMDFFHIFKFRVLYASVNIAGNGGTGSDHLAVIDTTTGAASIVGAYGRCTGVQVPAPVPPVGSCTIEGMEAIAFDSKGNLWGALREVGAAGKPGLYKISHKTGAATFVAPIRDLHGNPPTGGVVSLASCGNTLLKNLPTNTSEGEILYGGTGTPVIGANDGGRLIKIFIPSGLFTFVGDVPATTAGNSLGGLACDKRLF